jgi:hypothetical protein
MKKSKPKGFDSMKPMPRNSVMKSSILTNSESKRLQLTNLVQRKPMLKNLVSQKSKLMKSDSMDLESTKST